MCSQLVFYFLCPPIPQLSDMMCDCEKNRSQVILHTPPSLFALFENFDLTLRLGRPPQGGAGGGLLIGVDLQGVPLAAAPILEVYGPTQLLYSSAEEDEDSIVSLTENSSEEGGVLTYLFMPCRCLLATSDEPRGLLSNICLLVAFRTGGYNDSPHVSAAKDRPYSFLESS